LDDRPDGGPARPRQYQVAGGTVSARTAAPGLHLVATPIGNLGDITLRALEALAGVDVVLAEDTRVTSRLCDRYGIRTRLERHDAHAPPEAIARLVERLCAGERMALVSDAGTPLVSDPGGSLARAAIAAGVPVQALPGASSVLAALAVAGLPAERFLFAGFLPAHGPERRRAITSLASIPATLVIFEAPHRLAESLADLADLLGPREAAVARELTKLHETVTRGSLRELAGLHGEGGTRGEIVVVVAPPDDAPTAAGEDEVERRLLAALETLSPRDAAAVVAAELGLPKRPVYARAVRLAAERRRP
jgi:16S rRNA (cytidine1402-2'-O)-methyltransferase